MLHHHYYACACVLFELCRVILSLCRLGDCFLILRNPAYPVEYATTTWWQSILERGMNAIWGRRNSAEPRRVYHEETKWPPSKFLSRLSEKEACTRQIPGMVCEAKEYLSSKEWDSIDGDKRRQACWRFHYRLQTCIACRSTGGVGHLWIADPKRNTIAV